MERGFLLNTERFLGTYGKRFLGKYIWEAVLGKHRKRFLAQYGNIFIVKYSTLGKGFLGNWATNFWQALVYSQVAPSAASH